MAKRQKLKRSQIQELTRKFKDRAFIIGGDGIPWLTPLDSVPADLEENPAFILFVGNVNAARVESELDGMRFVARAYEIFKKNPNSELLFIKKSELDNFKALWISK